MRVLVDTSGATARLGGIPLSGTRRRQLLDTLGQGQMVSVMRTFAEQGSPSGSWKPLSPASLRWNKYTAGHKLLIGSGRLRNSIHTRVQGNTVIIGTNLSYAGVQQRGFSGTQNVREYSYTRKAAAGNRQARLAITNKLGRRQTVTRRTVSGVAFVTVRAHKRNISIPARPYLVFRPEDPARMRQVVRSYLAVAPEGGN